MKKFLVTLLVAALLAIGISAAETVLYQNDFSDPYTLFDFAQYRAEWEIRDEALYLTDVKAEGASDKDNYTHIIYQAPEPFTNYVLEVDIFDAMTSTGVLFNVQQGKVGSKSNAIYGYSFNLSRAADLFAFGSGDNKGNWLGNIKLGMNSKSIYSGMDVHMIVIVKDGKIGLNAINMETGYSVFSYSYSIGSNAKLDGLFTDGSIGFRAVQSSGDKVNANTMHFDNLVITTANETTVESVVSRNPAPKLVAQRIDLTNITPVYTNTFDDESALDEFEQYHGKWEVIDGKLYLTDVETSDQSFIIYKGKEELMHLTDYVVDVDVYNIQSQGGALIRVDSDKITGKLGGSEFYGYIAYTSFTGEKGALGYATASGGWGDNFKVSGVVTKPGANIHIQVATKGDNITYHLTDIDSGKILWSHTHAVDMWDEGTFGFRMYTKIYNEIYDCVMNTAFDNLVVSTFPDSGKTEIKMTIDSLTAFVNGESKTLDAAPIIRSSRTMLPVRFVAENLGATVGWDDATKTVSVKSADATIEIVIGATTAKVNGAEIALDSPAFIENGRTYLPVRVVAENLGATVGWDDATKTATLTK